MYEVGTIYLPSSHLFSYLSTSTEDLLCAEWVSKVKPNINPIEAQRQLSQSISSGAQYVTLWKYFSHPSLVRYSFATPPIKLKVGQQIGAGRLIANHLDQSLRCANEKHWAAVRWCLLHSFLRVYNVAIMRSQINHFPEPNQHMLDSLHPILLCGITYRAPLEMLSQ
jgi:hypothetical protein